MALGGPFAGFAFKIIPKGFFFDRLRVVAAADRTTLRYMNRAGSFVRITSQRSMRKARRMKLAEMPPDMRRLWHIRREMAKRTGEPMPRLPLAGSKPGEAPRVRVGLLKQHIYYAYDPSSRSVVIGPVGFRGSRVPSVLEYGGQTAGSTVPTVTIKPRPYMAPALAKVSPLLAGFWAEAWQATARRAA